MSPTAAVCSWIPSELCDHYLPCWNRLLQINAEPEDQPVLPLSFCVGNHVVTGGLGALGSLIALWFLQSAPTAEFICRQHERAVDPSEGIPQVGQATSTSQEPAHQPRHATGLCIVLMGRAGRCKEGHWQHAACQANAMLTAVRCDLGSTEETAASIRTILQVTCNL